MTQRTNAKVRPAPGTRERMVAGAADLLRRRGVTATSLREVVRHTRTPRGSLAHHFPDGKAQLLEEAVGYAQQHVSRPLRRALEEKGVVGGLRVFAEQWRATLEATGFEAGCPVMAVAIEHNVDEAGTRTVAQRRLLDLARRAFDEWAGILAEALRREGVPANEARSIAVLVIAAFEGALGLCRASRSFKPFDDVSKQLQAIVTHALARSRAPVRHRSRRPQD
jgi:AcrR family transcriptional regulator